MEDSNHTGSALDGRYRTQAFGVNPALFAEAALHSRPGPALRGGCVGTSRHAQPNNEPRQPGRRQGGLSPCRSSRRLGPDRRWSLGRRWRIRADLPFLPTGVGGLGRGRLAGAAGEDGGEGRGSRRDLQDAPVVLKVGHGQDLPQPKRGSKKASAEPTKGQCPGPTQGSNREDAGRVSTSFAST